MTASAPLPCPRGKALQWSHTALHQLFNHNRDPLLLPVAQLTAGLMAKRAVRLRPVRKVNLYLCFQAFITDDTRCHDNTEQSTLTGFGFK